MLSTASLDLPAVGLEGRRGLPLLCDDLLEPVSVHDLRAGGRGEQPSGKHRSHLDELLRGNLDREQLCVRGRARDGSADVLRRSPDAIGRAERGAPREPASIARSSPSPTGHWSPQTFRLTSTTSSYATARPLKRYATVNVRSSLSALKCQTIAAGGRRGAAMPYVPGEPELPSSADAPGAYRLSPSATPTWSIVSPERIGMSRYAPVKAPKNENVSRSVTCTAPFGVTRALMCAAGSVYSLASAAARRRAPPQRRPRSELHAWCLPNRILDLEERARLEVEHAGDDVRRHRLDRVVVGEDGVVEDLARDGDLLLGVGQLLPAAAGSSRSRAAAGRPRRRRTAGRSPRSARSPPAPAPARSAPAARPSARASPPRTSRARATRSP